MGVGNLLVPAGIWCRLTIGRKEKSKGAQRRAVTVPGDIPVQSLFVFSIFQSCVPSELSLFWGSYHVFAEVCSPFRTFSQTFLDEISD